MEVEAFVIALSLQQPKKKGRGRSPKSLVQVRIITPVPVMIAPLEPLVIRISSRNIK